MIQSVAREKQRLDTLFVLAGKLPPEEEALSHWARYLCVLTSGFIENSMRMLLKTYIEQHANDAVANFAWTRIKDLTNLNEERLARLLGSFDPMWRETFEDKTSSQQKDAIDSVVATRHLIAHGQSVGITLVRMKQYLAEVFNAVKIIDEECINQ